MFKRLLVRLSGVIAICLFASSASAAIVTYNIAGGDLTGWQFWSKSITTGFAGKSFDGNGAAADDLADQGATNVADYRCQVGLDDSGGVGVCDFPTLDALDSAMLLEAPHPWYSGTTPWTVTGRINPANWKATPTSFDATYSGTILYDDVALAVVGGTFTTTGTLAYHLTFGGAPYSMLMATLTNMSWDLTPGAGFGIATGTTDCFLGDVAVQLNSSGLFCSATSLSQYRLEAGNEGLAGTARPGISFDPGTGELILFMEGFTTLTGSTTSFEIDNRATFQVTATASPVPVPAAVWLFGSAVGLLGGVRFRAGRGLAATADRCRRL